MSYIVVDVESDGPIIGTHSMVCFGAVVVREGLKDTFYSELMHPIDDPLSGEMTTAFIPSALAISGFSRHEQYQGIDPHIPINSFCDWLSKVSKGKPILISDNNGYDASWINWYMYQYSHSGENPFGWSSRRIGDMFTGFYNDPYYKWKKHRKTSHTHHPVDDAKGNAEALLYLQSQGLKIKFK